MVSKIIKNSAFLISKLAQSLSRIPVPDKHHHHQILIKMQIKFIQVVIPLLTLISCREYEEVILNDYSYESLQTSEKKIQHKDSVSDAKDSTVIKAVPEEDPPVKHGGHWKIKK